MIAVMDSYRRLSMIVNKNWMTITRSDSAAVVEIL